jgi:hypothetical protein
MMYTGVEHRLGYKCNIGSIDQTTYTFVSLETAAIWDNSEQKHFKGYN